MSWMKPIPNTIDDPLMGYEVVEMHRDKIVRDSRLFAIKRSLATEGREVSKFMMQDDEGKEFANRWKIENLVKKYSDHIAFPIFLTFDNIEYDKEDKEKRLGMLFIIQIILQKKMLVIIIQMFQEIILI